MRLLGLLVTRCLLVAGCAMFVAGEGAAASVTRQIDQLFQRDRVERAALSPDGRRVAFAVRESSGLEVFVWNLVRPVGEPVRLRLDPRPAAELVFFAWLDGDRLIAVPNAPVVLAVDLRTRQVAAIADEKTLAATIEKRRPGQPIVRVLRLQAEPAILTLEVRWFAASGDVTLDVVTVDLRSGEQRLVQSRASAAPGGLLLADREGQPRLLYERGGRTPQYLYQTFEDERGSWRPLDRVLGKDRQANFEVTTQNFLGERAVPLGFASEGKVLYYASNEGRDTFGVYALDLATGRRGNLAVEDARVDAIDPAVPFPEEALVFDRAGSALAGVRRSGVRPDTVWLDRDLMDVQAVLAQKFPGRDVNILEWDKERARFLFVVTAGHDAGRFFVFDRTEDTCAEYFRQGSLRADEANRVELVSWEQPGTDPLTGRVTWPHAATDAPPPLVIWLHDQPWQRPPPGMGREAQALAAQGFAVLEVDHRGTAGWGRRHLEAVRESFDRVPLADVMTALAALEAQGGFDPTRVALVGEGTGGYLALGALQLHPERFACAAAINAPLDLADVYRGSRDSEAYRRDLAPDFLRQPAEVGGLAGDDGGAASAPRSTLADDAELRGGDRGRVSFEQERVRWFFAPAGRQKIAVDDALEALVQPVLLLHDPQNAVVNIAPTKRLRDVLLRRKQVAEWIELSPEFARGELEARAGIIRRIGEFLRTRMPKSGGRGGRE